MAQLRSLLMDPMFASALKLTADFNRQTPQGGMYHFKRGITLTTWGEEITVTLMPIDTFNCNVEVKSECRMPTQVVDWGKNRSNVEAVFVYIFKNIARYAPVSAPPPQPVAAQFCSRCGTKLMPDSNFCTKCGAKVR